MLAQNHYHPSDKLRIKRRNVKVTASRRTVESAKSGRECGATGSVGERARRWDTGKSGSVVWVTWRRTHPHKLPRGSQSTGKYEVECKVSTNNTPNPHPQTRSHPHSRIRIHIQCRTTTVLHGHIHKKNLHVLFFHN